MVKCFCFQLPFPANGCNTNFENHSNFSFQDYAEEEEAPPSMAPPPLPPDYGNSGGSGPIGWSSSTTAAATSVPISNPAPPPAQPVADDDWGWSNDTPSTDRYQNAPADDPWSANAAPNNSDNNYNQAGSSSDPFDPFDQPPQQKSSTAPPVTASANQVRLVQKTKKRF